MDSYRKYALCAIGFFRSRWKKRPLYKNTKRAQQYVSEYGRCCHMARHYIKKARAERA